MEVPLSIKPASGGLVVLAGVTDVLELAWHAGYEVSCMHDACMYVELNVLGRGRHVPAFRSRLD